MTCEQKGLLETIDADEGAADGITIKFRSKGLEREEGREVESMYDRIAEPDSIVYSVYHHHILKHKPC